MCGDVEDAYARVNSASWGRPEKMLGLPAEYDLLINGGCEMCGGLGSIFETIALSQDGQYKFDYVPVCPCVTVVPRRARYNA